MHFILLYTCKHFLLNVMFQAICNIKYTLRISFTKKPYCFDKTLHIIKVSTIQEIKKEGLPQKGLPAAHPPFSYVYIGILKKSLFFLTHCTFQMPPPPQIPPEIACGCQAQVLLAEESEVGPTGGPHPSPQAPHPHRVVGGGLGPANAWCHLAPSLPDPS